MTKKKIFDIIDKHLKLYVEKSPSPVYGARLELVYGLIAHRGFESLLLRQKKTPLKSEPSRFGLNGVSL